ncbi:hypothetical protein I6A84_00315 [Frankia sp. CNm7]|uniref:Uncharacterized protein n=1 Tax=Frankia nepalensis TaxID=1836974 RepID=A0A937RGM5_9ACTN|nr:hypothetical protein [Frankia nepalensis]MBL7502805.1 hypothetical protein [Frankia nepalensis]MBL7516541.1 hypothetical protein [Frankia nepalensis]MBL7516607.1 hypothetical protein [Frankia nepalensis]MBL7629842.1 hypothetical protein [Frankia nepalensis]
MKGLGRSAALLGLSGAASLILTLGPGLGVAHALEGDKGDQRDNGILDDKGDKDGGLFDDKECRDRDKDKDGWFDDKDDKDRDKDDDWFDGGILDDKDKDRDCPVGVGVGVGVGVVGGGVGGGGVAAGGGGMSAGDVPLAPLAGVGLGALLLTAGVASRRRGQGAS